MNNNKILYVVIPLNNPRRYKKRFELYEKFMIRILREPNIRVYTVELAFADRDHKVVEHSHVEHSNHTYIQLRSDQELWHKENLINLGVSRLPIDWEYVAWIDADIAFNNEDWVMETIEQLQHYPVVQMFQTAIDLGPDGRALQIHSGFAYQYSKYEIYNKDDKHYENWHPGYAWAVTRDMWNLMGGVIDISILGAADNHMAHAFIGKIDVTLNLNLTEEYKSMIRHFQEKIKSQIGHIGYVNGNIVHYWHGKKANRRYHERWSILVNNNYNPISDIKRDWQGIITLNDNKSKLKRDIQNYFILRNEDSIDE